MMINVIWQQSNSQPPHYFVAQPNQPEPRPKQTPTFLLPPPSALNRVMNELLSSSYFASWLARLLDRQPCCFSCCHCLNSFFFQAEKKTHSPIQKIFMLWPFSLLLLLPNDLHFGNAQKKH